MVRDNRGSPAGAAFAPGGLFAAAAIALSEASPPRLAGAGTPRADKACGADPPLA